MKKISVLIALTAITLSGISAFALTGNDNESAMIKASEEAKEAAPPTTYSYYISKLKPGTIVPASQIPNMPNAYLVSGSTVLGPQAIRSDGTYPPGYDCVLSSTAACRTAFLNSPFVSGGTVNMSTYFQAATSFTSPNMYIVTACGSGGM